MGSLLLVRHGQASFLEADYDRLSAVGETQARLLGELWARQGLRASHLYSGPRVRQLRTAEIARDASLRAGVPQPAIEVLEGLDEMKAEEVLRLALPRLLESDVEVRRLHDDFASAPGREAQGRSFQRLFAHIVERWVRGALLVDGAALEGVEAWAEFRARVAGALHHMRASDIGQRGRRVCAFTSAGPLAVATQAALDLTDERTIELTWMVRNSGVSEFLYSGDRFSLSAFNATAHLDDPGLVTYR